MTVLETILEFRNTLIFYSLIGLLVYLNRDKFQKLGSLAYIYRTKFGLDLMEKAGKRFRGLLHIWGYIGIIIAYLGFIFFFPQIVMEAYKIIIGSPDASGGSPVLPGLPIAGLGITFPLVIGWISLFIIMVVHEFSHGVMARAHDLKVKSSGIAFFGPILGAFVEPDDKQLKKQPKRVQLSVFAAGPVSNILLALLISFVLAPGVLLIQDSIYPSHGVNIRVMMNESFPAYSAGIPENSTIISVNGAPVTTTSSFSKSMVGIKPGENIKITTKEGSFDTVAAENPADRTKSYLGVWIIGEDRRLIKEDILSKAALSVINWVKELLFWTGLISLMIGLFNLIPIYITDGAQMLKANAESIFRKNKALGEKIWGYINAAVLFIVLILLLPLVKGIFSGIFSIITGQIKLF